jgi:hypothetical protein
MGDKHNLQRRRQINAKYRSGNLAVINEVTCTSSTVMKININLLKPSGNFMYYQV